MKIIYKYPRRTGYDYTLMTTYKGWPMLLNTENDISLILYSDTVKKKS